ncbi:phytanoyl-CoA dioxygenase family protein [Streptacidiphilus jiangxiensis]|uniref:Ectoine hydroxylase n=1 Tax=Streptacidiphilus jiangxiensis TaxID=235985 RepID=A0A1H7VNV7_STRJI|nr:phytanoyl-CoA dioxygenase family protein [Streptacidiphilus jiangxiensis]SEM10850.1 ectoine hydroxylase [Streptacidiphilus jiangxiensis]
MPTLLAESAELKDAYTTEGWCRSPFRFGPDAVDLLRRRIDLLCQEDRPEVVHERDGGAVRGIHGCHAYDELCAALVRHPLLLGLAETLVGGPVYVYQFKVNLKQAREGAAWPWHQDFAFWSEEDRMPTDRAVNLAVPLDEVHADNGPLVVLPGTHRLGLFDLPERDGEPDGRADWRSHVSADLAYTVRTDRAEELERRMGRRTILGPAGSVHAFHPSIVHASSNNRSPDRRALLLITYNAVDNAPAQPTRPAFLVGRDTEPVTPVDDPRLGVESG